MSKADDTALWDGKSCLSCKRSELIIGKGGYVTCGNLECKNPDFGDVLNARFAEREREKLQAEKYRLSRLADGLFRAYETVADLELELNALLNQPEGGSTEL